jgi:hypothetical protein
MSESVTTLARAVPTARPEYRRRTTIREETR